MSKNRKYTREPKPRGFYKMVDPWTKDKTKDYFEGPMNEFVWPVAKAWGLLLLAQLIQFVVGRYWLTLLTCMLATYFYPQIVAYMVEGAIPMPPMDNQCFCSAPGVFVNFMNCTWYDSDNMKILDDAFREVFALMPKFRYKIREIAGDLYYEEMSMEETIEKIFVGPQSEDKVLRCQDDINAYIADNMNEKVPLDGP